MISVGIKELKNNLSRYLRSVKKGDEVLITERGRTIARIVPKNQKKKSTREALSALVEKGSVVLPEKSIDKQILTPIKVPGKPVSEMALEDRR
jgi:prevent-host-death family protein